MITSLILFALSGLFIAYMFWSNRGTDDEYAETGFSADGMQDDQLAVRNPSAVLLSTSICSTDLDIRLRSMYQRAISHARSIDREYVKTKMHQIAEYGEKKALAIVSRLLNRFGKVRDVVTGKDLPKNKGSVSFFLNHIIHHKSQLSGYMKDETQRTLDARIQKRLEINRK